MKPRKTRSWAIMVGFAVLGWVGFGLGKRSFTAPGGCRLRAGVFSVATGSFASPAAPRHGPAGLYGGRAGGWSGPPRPWSAPPGPFATLAKTLSAPHRPLPGPEKVLRSLQRLCPRRTNPCPKRRGFGARRNKFQPSRPKPHPARRKAHPPPPTAHPTRPHPPLPRADFSPRDETPFRHALVCAIPWRRGVAPRSPAQWNCGDKGVPRGSRGTRGKPALWWMASLRAPYEPARRRPILPA